MPLPAGVWKANINGRILDMEVAQTEAGGAVRVQMQGLQLGNMNRGIWNEAAQRLVFGVAGGPPNSPFSGSFDGYLFSTPANPEPGQDIQWTLAGSFTVLFPAAANPDHPATASGQRTTFGWYATYNQVR
jgi:hypothetical protein